MVYLMACQIMAKLVLHPRAMPKKYFPPDAAREIQVNICRTNQHIGGFAKNVTLLD